MAKFKLGIQEDFLLITIYHLSFLVVLAALHKFHFHKATHIKYIFELESGKKQNEIILDK